MEFIENDWMNEFPSAHGHFCACARGARGVFLDYKTKKNIE